MDRVGDLAGRVPDAIASVSDDHPGDLARRLADAVARLATKTLVGLRSA